MKSDNLGFAFGAMTIAFIVFITARGELPTYLSFFLWTPTQPGPPTPAQQAKSPFNYVNPTIQNTLNSVTNTLTSKVTGAISGLISNPLSFLGF